MYVYNKETIILRICHVGWVVSQQFAQSKWKGNKFSQGQVDAGKMYE